MSKIPEPKIALRDATGQMPTTLLDRMMSRGQTNLKAEGIDLHNLPSNASPKKDSMWEDLTPIMEQIREGIAQHTINTFDIDEALKGHPVENMNELQLTIQTTKKDLFAFSDTFAAIRRRHQGFSGMVKDGGETTIYLSTFNDYVMLSNQVRALMFNSMLVFTDAQKQIQDLLRKQAIEAQKQAEAEKLTDPKVVSDVEFKQV